MTNEKSLIDVFFPLKQVYTGLGGDRSGPAKSNCEKTSGHTAQELGEAIEIREKRNSREYDRRATINQRVCTAWLGNLRRTSEAAGEKRQQWEGRSN